MIYNDFLESYDSESSAYLANQDNLSDISVSSEDTLVPLMLEENIDRRSERSDSNVVVRIIGYRVYDIAYHEPYQPDILTENATKLTGMVVKIAPGIEYLESISLISEQSEKTEREKVYFVLESANASSEEGAAKNLVICHDNSVISHINLINSNRPF